MNGYAKRGGGDRKNQKGREREPVIISFTTLLSHTFGTFEIIGFWQEPIIK